MSRTGERSSRRHVTGTAATVDRSAPRSRTTATPPASCRVVQTIARSGRAEVVATVRSRADPGAGVGPATGDAAAAGDAAPHSGRSRRRRCTRMTTSVEIGWRRGRSGTTRPFGIRTMRWDAERRILPQRQACRCSRGPAITRIMPASARHFPIGCRSTGSGVSRRWGATPTGRRTIRPRPNCSMPATGSACWCSTRTAPSRRKRKA